MNTARRIANTFAAFGNILNNVKVPTDVSARNSLRDTLKSALMTFYKVHKDRLAELDPGKQASTDEKKLHNESVRLMRDVYMRLRERIDSEHYRNPRKGTRVSSNENGTPNQSFPTKEEK